MLLKTCTRSSHIAEKDLWVRWFSNFLWKIISWACLLKSGLNDIFHWCDHSAVSCKSLFNSYAVVLTSWIMGNSEVWSANNLTVEMISIDWSLI